MIEGLGITFSHLSVSLHVVRQETRADEEANVQRLEGVTRAIRCY